MYRLLCVSLVLALSVTAVLGATISGVVTDHMSRKPLEGALVMLQLHGKDDASVTKVTDQDGRFFFENVKEARYNIEAMLDGYYKNVLFDLDVVNERNYDVSIRLLKCEKKGHGKHRHGKRDAEYCFMIGGIEVQSEEAEIIPEEVVTTRKISSGEIEHMQATNLGDVLSLVPGVTRSTNPGLNYSSTVGIRAVGTGNSSPEGIESFGTGIIVDGNELSQDGDVGGAGTSGLDLRSLPADNIKSVEVISGIPSVEYGNISNGVVKVETKSGVIAPKMKIKFNPDTKEASFIHGFKIGKSELSYNMNFARSERDLRLDKDAIDRYHFKTDLIRPFLNNRLNAKLSNSLTYLYVNQKPEDEKLFLRYNHEYFSNNSLTLDFNQNESVNYNAVFSLNVSQEDNHTEKWNSESVYIPYDSTDGITDHDTLVVIGEDSTLYHAYYGYIGKKDVIGKKWKVAAKINRRQNISLLNVDHELLTGMKFQSSFNTGEGVILDSIFNYYGPYSTQRSYSYTEYPRLNTVSIYIEDQINGILLNHKYDLMLGLRYDNFDTDNILTGRNGSFLNPRFNFRYFFTDDIRIRFGAGSTTKSMSLSYLYKPPAYDEFIIDDVIVEEVQDQTNPDLQTYSTLKYELSLDWKFKNGIGTTLTGYLSQSDDQPSSLTYPWGYDSNPDTITSASYSIYQNIGWRENSGLEFTVKTKRYKNLQLRSSIAYQFSKNGSDDLRYDSSPDTSYGELTWYQPSWYWKERVVVNLQINFISQRLGVWTTLDVQYIPLDHKRTVYRDEGYEKLVENSYYNGIAEWHQGMSNYYDRFLYDYSGYWMFNFRITKSLSQKAEMSFYVNNVFDDRAIWYSFTDSQRELNPEIYFGLEVSVQW